MSIPVPFEGKSPRTAQGFGNVQPVEGLRGFNADARASVAAAGETALVDARGFIAEAQSAGQIGRAVAEEGSALAALQLKQNEAVNIAREAEAATAMEEAEAALEAELLKERDETKWGAVHARVWAAAEKSILGVPLSDTAKEAIGARLDGVKRRSAAAVMTAGARQSFRKAGDAVRSRRDAAVEAGDYGTAESLSRQLVEAGYAGAEEVESNRRMIAEDKVRRSIAAEEASRQAAGSGISARIEKGEDPAAIAAEIAADPERFSVLGSAGRLKLQEDLKGLSAQRQNETLMRVQDEIVRRVNGRAGWREMLNALPEAAQAAAGKLLPGAGASLQLPLSRTELAAMGQAGHLRPVQLDQLWNFQEQLVEARAAQLPLDRRAAADLSREIENYSGDRKSDPAGEKWGMLAQRAEMMTTGDGVEKRAAGELLMQKLKVRHPFRERDPREDLPEDMEEIFSDSLEYHYSRGLFGPTGGQAAPQSSAGAGASGPPAARADPDTFWNYASERRRLWKLLVPLARSNPARFTDQLNVRAWVAENLKVTAAGQAAAEWLGRNTNGQPEDWAAPHPDAALNSAIDSSLTE